MPVQVNVAVPAEQFAFASFPRAARIEFERCVPFDDDRLPYLWVSGRDGGESERESSEVEGVDPVATVDGARLVRARWPSERPEVVDAIAASDATCLAGFRERGVWNLTLRFPSAASVSEWYRACPRSGDGVTIQRVRTGRPRRTDHASRLTDRQREALRAALEASYFAVPRETSLEALAERLDVSDTAVSQRLRRGIENLIIDRFGDVRP